MSEGAREPVTLIAITVADIQSMAQKELGRDLNEADITAVLKRLKNALDARIEWLPLLRRCIEEIELEAKYADWLKQVGEAVWTMAACTVDDLPDFDYYSLFIVESTPSQAADAVLLSIGFSRFG